MIETVEFLRDFGIYRNFQWNVPAAIPTFGKFNLIYGWNYAGKTTLSRLFQSLDTKSLSSEHAKASFKITRKDEPALESHDLSTAPKVCVFNRDFVNANFVQEAKAPAFVIGQPNAALKNRLTDLQKRLERVGRVAGQLSPKSEVITNRLLNAGTRRAADIGEILGDRLFKRPDLDRRIMEVRNNPDTYTLSAETIEGKLSTLRAGEDFKELAPIGNSLPDLATLIRQVNEMLGQTATNRAIARLKENPRIEEWVRHGLAFHQDGIRCEFCQSPLEKSRLEELGGHFSVEYESLVRDLKAKIDELAKVSFNVTLHDSMRLLQEFRSAYTGKCEMFAGWAEWATKIRDSVAQGIHEKLLSIETPQNWSDDIDGLQEGPDLVAEINAVVQQHNKTVRGLEQAQAEAKTALEKHFASVHFTDTNVPSAEAELRRLADEVGRCGTVSRAIAAQIAAVEAKIKGSSIAIETLNKLLRYLLTTSNIEVASLGQAEFVFRRGGVVANNLSDGEKTAVTFAYFLTRLESQGSALADTIVFVDDPISSLDANHIYAVFALVTTRLEGCRQLFVSTHNSEFFNLLKGRWTDDRSGRRKISSFYYVSRHCPDGGVPEAHLTALPKLLMRFKSEYEFVFAQLVTFKDMAAPSEHEVYTAPNLLRKFLEAYLGFRKPHISAWHDKLDLLIDSPEKIREIHKFADDASHLQSKDRTLGHSSFVASSQGYVKDVLDGLQVKDPEHHASLITIIQSA